MEMNPKNKKWGKKHYLDKADGLADALKRSGVKADDPEYVERVAGGRFPGTSDDGVSVKRIEAPGVGPHGGINSVMTHGPKAWDHAPSTPEEKAIYEGWHVHGPSNPYGLHTHIPGGELTGGHTHGPQNKFGEHTHKDTGEEQGPVSRSGKHTHSHQYPDGAHEHPVQDFG